MISKDVLALYRVKIDNEVEDLRKAARIMTKIGGSFASTLGQAFLLADFDNKARIYVAFDELFEKYRQMDED